MAGAGASARPVSRRVTELLAFGILPLGLFVWVVGSSALRGLNAYGLEFRGNLWLPGKLILEGRSPYEPHRLDSMLAAFRAGHVPRDLPALAQAVYPAPAHVLAAPLSLLPFEVSMGLFVAASLLAVAAAVWALGVEDWRCYGVTFLSVAVIEGIKLGGITPFLFLAVALLWRYRNSRAGASLAAASMIAGKLFLWPMALWLLATGRRVTFAWAVLASAAAALCGWAVIGFRGLTGYPHLLSTLASLEQTRSDSLVATAMRFGLTETESRVMALIIGLAMLAGMARLARRGQERESFVLALGAAFTLTPIVWLQYLTLAVAPIALLRRRLSFAWGIPLLVWLSPTDGALHPSSDQLLVHQGVLALTVAFSLWPLAGGATLAECLHPGAHFAKLTARR